ncbi:MAG TPA: hypothetical protein VGX95_14325, partial [Xanthobacteraceae bacterium]|nr:hypothetical protein [Xanthobacteraceae bacterium]
MLEIWRWIKRALEWGEHTEYVAHHLHDVGRVWTMISEPPWWLNILLLIAGTVLIWWDLRRRQKSVVPAAVSFISSNSAQSPATALPKIPTRLRIQFSG